MKTKTERGGLVLSVLAVLAVCLFPVMFMYCQNAAEASFSECWVSIAAFCGFGLVLFAVLTIALHKPELSAVISAITMLAMLNFAGIEQLMLKLCKELRYWQCLPILIVILIHVGALLKNRVSEENCGYAVRIISGVFCFLILLNVGMATPVIIRRIATEKQSEKYLQEKTIQTASKDDSPNIYYREPLTIDSQPYFLLFQFIFQKIKARNSILSMIFAEYFG